MLLNVSRTCNCWFCLSAATDVSVAAHCCKQPALWLIHGAPEALFRWLFRCFHLSQGCDMGVNFYHG
jgi:hypothetical protein